MNRYEQLILDRIFRIGNILGQVCMSEKDIKECASYIVEVYPKMKEQFKCLTHSKVREVIENI